LEDWSFAARAEPDEASFQLAAGDEEKARLQLVLGSAKPPVLQDDWDLLAPRPTGADLRYYFMSRLAAEGTLRLAGKTRKVAGDVWLDRAWGAVAPSQGQIALNRFALQLHDGRDLMCVQLRRRDGSGTPVASCILIGAEGSVQSYRRRDIRLEPLAGRWSGLGGTKYPRRWSLELRGRDALRLQIEPRLESQEEIFPVAAWSGSVWVTGNAGGHRVSGHGHMELSGYARPETGA
jgi:predicted secreted hydrolase